jgi:hypothetical protein
MDPKKKRTWFCRNYGKEECIKYLFWPHMSMKCSDCEHQRYVDDLECGDCRYMSGSKAGPMCNHNYYRPFEGQRSEQCLRFYWKEGGKPVKGNLKRQDE